MGRLVPFPAFRELESPTVKEEIMAEKDAAPASEEEVVEQPVQQEADDLRKQIGVLEQKLQETNEISKAHQRSGEEKTRQLRQTQEREGRIVDLEKRLEVLTAMTADLVDRGDPEEEPSQRRKRSEEYLNKLAKEETTPKQHTPYEVEEALRLAQSANLNFDTSEELLKAYRLFSRGQNAEGLEETRRVVEGKTEPPEKKELTEEEEETIARKVWEKKGMNVSDAGKPAAGTTNRAQDFKKYADGEMSDEEAKKKGLF